MGTLRFVLALAVAVGHTASATNIDASWVMPGSRAVQIFYMISGFLMALILNEKYPGSPAGNRTFWINRLVKIFAPYAAIVAITVVACLVWKACTGDALLLQPWFTEASTMDWSTWAFAILTNLFIVGQEWGYLLIYRAGSLFFSLHAFAERPNAAQFIIDTPSWTLSLELMFYAMAPFVVRRHILLIAALAYASSFLRFQAYHFGFYSEATNYRFFPFELSLFFYGAVCFRLKDLLTPSDPRITRAIAGLVILLVILKPRYYVASQYELYCIIGVLLPALFDFSRRYKWDRMLGDLSYPLYLVHYPLAVMIGSLAQGRFPAVVSVAVSIGAAIALDRFLVEPLDAWRQSRASAIREKASVHAADAGHVLV